MTPRFVLTTAALLGSLSMGTAASANYVLLADDDTIFAGSGNTLLNAFAGDGTDAYVVVTGGSDAAIHKVTGAGTSNTVAPQVDSATLSSITGRTTYSAAYFDLVGNVLASGEIAGDQLYLYGLPTTNNGVVFADEASLDAFAGGSGGVFFGGVDQSNGVAYFYESRTDGIVASTGINSFATTVADTDLTALTGDDTISGLAAANGVLYFGNAAGSGNTEGLYSWDLGTGTGSTLVSAAQADGILGGTTGINPTNTSFFAAPDGNIYFFDTGYDAILSFDPTDALNTLQVVLSQAQLLAGPGNSGVATSSNGPSIGTVADLGWVDGQLAFLIDNDSTVTGELGGLYAIPEPATAALLGLGGLAMLRRRSA
ncbi:MAG: PEP-CTERM sorting domain-containing protein [Planctomycetota bacterium]